jgi:endoglucanase
MQIHLNQAGFATHAPKLAVVLSESPITEGGFIVETSSGEVVHRGDLTPAPQAWDTHAAHADFSPVVAAGAYRLRIGEQASLPFRIGEREPGIATLHPATEFFFIQRCGMEVPGWHGPCHMDDGVLPDGTFQDATGGWHDAGDYNKYNGYTPLSIFALLAAYRTAPAFYAERQRNGMPAILDEAHWGAEWLAKMIHPSGKLWRDIFSSYRFWGRPEDETDNVPGTGDERAFRTEPPESQHQEMGVAAFAEMALAFPEEAHVWRQRAERLWQALDAAAGEKPILIAESILGALALYRLTGEVRYEEAAAKLSLRLLTNQREDGRFSDPEIVDCGLPAAALASTAMAFQPLRGHFLPPLLRYLEGSLALSDNAFRMLQYDKDDFFFNYEKPENWHVGQNSMYLSQAWAAGLIWTLSGDVRAYDHAWDLVDWVLGRNPFGLCLMDGVGSRHTALYHHRYCAIPDHENGAVPGAVVNGIVRESVERDVPRYDLKTEGRAAYQTNEPWLPHNAYYLLALTTLCYGQREG